MSNKKYYFGIDIGGTTIKAGIFDEQGILDKKEEFPTRKEEGGSKILGDIVDFVKKKQEEYDNKIIGIGIGVPGSVTQDGVVNKCVNLGWGVINVKEELSKLTGLEVCVGNDANMAALGEYAKANEGEESYSSALFITLGTGVGGGIIVDGKPLIGANGAAAEIGHLPIVWDESENCNCGKKGCLEQVASATGVVRTANRLLNASDEPSLLRKQDYISAKTVFDAAKEGDMIALQAVKRVTHFLGLGLACACGVVDPQIIIIGGGMSKAGEFLRVEIEKEYKENVFHPSRKTPVVLAKLGNDAGMYGAAQLIINS